MALERKEIIIILGFVLIYAFLVRGMLVDDSRDFWHDEAFQYEFSKMPVSYILDSNDVHPPLFTLITKAIIEAFNPSIHTLRLIMVVVSMVFLGSLYFTMSRIWGRGEALLVTMMASFTPTFVYYSTEFRSYIFVLLLVVWQVYFFNIMIKLDRKFFSTPIGESAGRWWLLLSLLMIYSHYMAGLILLVQFVYLVVAEKQLYLKRWIFMAICSIPLTIYIIKTLPKIQSFWFTNIDFVSLVSTFAYIMSPPVEQPIGWSFWIYGIAMFTMVYFRKSLTKKHLQFAMYLILPVITMWIISQFFPFYHHRYFLFGGMMIFPLTAWGAMEWGRRVDEDAEQALVAIIIILTLFSMPVLVQSTNKEVRDSAIFLYNETKYVQEEVYVIHTSPFSQTPYKVYLPQYENLLYTNLTKAQRFTAGGAVIMDDELIKSIESMGNFTYLVSDRKMGQVLWSEGGLNVCKILQD